MTLRTVDTIGVDRIVEELGLQVFGPAYRLLERMPWPPTGTLRLPLLPREYFTLADPLAMFVFKRLGAMEGWTRSMGSATGMEILVPNGDRLEDGFLYQRFLVWLDGKTLKAGKGPEERGAQMGVLSVLHTWGQRLDHHPHVHCVVTGGGLALGRSRWVSCRPGFLFPVRVIGHLFRGRFLAELKAAFARDELRFHGSTMRTAIPRAVRT